MKEEKPKMSKRGEIMTLPNIEAERIRHRMSREDFASMLGVSRRTVQNWQNGSTDMPLSKLVRLSEIWGCSIDYLLGLCSNKEE